jgi:predicted nucleic acid-binding protein
MNLHAGESEAIALALDRQCDAIVLDDKLARETADRLGLRVIGTLGILILAKEKGLLSEIRPLVIQMMERISFRISPAVLNKALSLLSEPLL